MAETATTSEFVAGLLIRTIGVFASAIALVDLTGGRTHTWLDGGLLFLAVVAATR